MPLAIYPQYCSETTNCCLILLQMRFSSHNCYQLCGSLLHCLFTLTSKEGDGSYQAFLNNEARYTRLVKPFPERAEKLFAESEKVAKERFDHLQKLVTLYGND